MKITIVGAGISGLVAAFYLQKKHDVTIIEKTPRAGGWIQSVEKDGFLFELGPRGFRPHPHTLQLAEALGLKPIAASFKKRYLLQNDKLCPFSFALLLKNGLLRDLATKPSKKEDETISEFFERHFSAKFVENIVDPAVKGIFGGDIHKLSIRSCFPSLWARDQKKGSLLHFPKPKKPPLYSFLHGMEELTRALSQRVNIQYNTSFDDDYSQDCTILTAKVMDIPYLSLTTISMGWHRATLPKRGFGFLVPSKENKDFLGMTWDSEIFPQQRGKTRICVMMRKKNEGVALDAAKRYLGLQDPDALFVHKAKQAIPQYPLNYHLMLAEKKWPPNIYLLGSNINVAVNDCISSAMKLAWTLNER